MPKLCDIKFPSGCKTLPEGFWSSVDVWIKKPHVVNKRLCGAKETEGENVGREALKFLLDDSESSTKVLSFITGHVSETEEHEEPWCFSVRTIIPKVNRYGSKSHKEVILKDYSKQQVTFLPFEEDAGGQVCLKSGNIYQILLINQDCEEWVVELHLMAPDAWFSDGVAYPHPAWFSTDLLPKLVRWASENKSSEFSSTLSLLPVEKYSATYQQLKGKYKALVKVWPEVTDPEKFVYEDVAIATYLLASPILLVNPSFLVDSSPRALLKCERPQLSGSLDGKRGLLARFKARSNTHDSFPQVLWAEERARKGLTARQTFVDLGCGNGLLVHILTNEGHSGKGIDVRKRKIWDMYGPQTVLEEKAITPSESFLFPGTDWLIGNHSDELTPWIPVIAARSSYACRYFVLPCCFYDFYGKYQRRQCRKSQYREYIDFIAEVSHISGFQTDEDCLRIPSTKRVCLVGLSRNYQLPGEAEAERRRTDYIHARRLAPGVTGQRSAARNDGEGCCGSGEAHGSTWGSGFQPRERVETVRNCAALPRDIVDGVVQRVASSLLEMTDDGGEGATGDWNRGGSLSVGEAAGLLEPQTLQLLKKECGGLQTLLRNHHQVFRVEGGRVFIRDGRDPKPSRGDAKRKPVAPGALKTRPCWFYDHHPQRCPLQAEACAFAHGPDDLRPSGRPLKKIKRHVC